MQRVTKSMYVERGDGWRRVRGMELRQQEERVIAKRRRMYWEARRVGNDSLVNAAEEDKYSDIPNEKVAYQCLVTRRSEVHG